MKTFEIIVQKREKLGKSETKRLRSQDMVPCVMYGGNENLHFYAHENAFGKLVYTPEVHLVELDLDGAKHKAILKEIQFHPVTDKIIHIDFVEVFEDKPVVASIPIELKGNSIGIKNGGKLRQKRRYLKVKGLIADLPEKLAIDVTKVNIGDVVKVGDLNYPKLEILDPHRSMVVSIVSSRVAMKGMSTEEETEAGTEAGPGTEAEAENAAAEEKSE